jgi:hypothetical protein
MIPSDVLQSEMLKEGTVAVVENLEGDRPPLLNSVPRLANSAVNLHTTTTTTTTTRISRRRQIGSNLQDQQAKLATSRVGLSSIANTTTMRSSRATNAMQTPRRRQNASRNEVNGRKKPVASESISDEESSPNSNDNARSTSNAGGGMAGGARRNGGGDDLLNSTFQHCDTYMQTPSHSTGSPSVAHGVASASGDGAADSDVAASATGVSQSAYSDERSDFGQPMSIFGRVAGAVSTLWGSTRAAAAGVNTGVSDPMDVDDDY